MYYIGGMFLIVYLPGLSLKKPMEMRVEKLELIYWHRIRSQLESYSTVVNLLPINLIKTRKKLKSHIQCLLKSKALSEYKARFLWSLLNLLFTLIILFTSIVISLWNLYKYPLVQRLEELSLNGKLKDCRMATGTPLYWQDWEKTSLFVEALGNWVEEAVE